MPKTVLFLLLSLLLCNCDPQTGPGSSQPSSAEKGPSGEPGPGPVTLLQKALEPILVETAAEALPVWRSCADRKPALVLLSQNPFLLPVPVGLEKAVTELIRQAPAAELLSRSSPFATDPLLLPDMAVGAALEAGLFSRILWVLPTEFHNGDKEPLTLKTFRTQLLERRLISPEEGESLRLEDDRFVGTLRGVPFVACRLTNLPPALGDAILHFDLSYFRSIYQGEIKTPLYPLVRDTLTGLRAASLPVLAATISLSTIDGTLPLETRFLGRDVATFFRQPELLDTMAHPNWSRRAQALYLENFFQKERVRDLYLAMEKESPEDPSVKYALYQSARQLKMGDLAFRYLSEAVRLDRMYASEYLDLAPVALERNRPDEALRMLDLALGVLPDNPFVILRRIEYSLQLEDTDQVDALLRPLERLPWSPIYFPEIPARLKHLRELNRGPHPLRILPEHYGRKTEKRHP
jgi:hypothetical protein